MVSRGKKMEERLVSELVDLLFEGRGQEIKTIGSSGSSIPLEEVSRSVLVRTLLSGEIAEVERELKRKVLRGDYRGKEPLDRLMRLAKTWKAMKLLTSEGKRKIPNLFLVDVLFLEECYDSLFSSAGEEEVLLTGVKAGKLHVLTKRIEIDTKGSTNRVEDLPKSSHRELKRIDGYGMPFLGAFHSHPEGGPPRPSDTDLDQLETYETRGHEAVGGIFTEDGLVRFFTQDLAFEVLVTGSKVKKEGEDLYRLELEEV